MDKKIILIAGLALLLQNSFAETCPSVDDIKNHRSLTGWKLYDSEDNTPLASSRMTQFKKNIDQFALAEWSIQEQKKSGTVHCYYQDSNGSNLEAYLAKENFIPVDSNQYWYQVSGFMHCAAGVDKCEFKADLSLKNQLAKK